MKLCLDSQLEGVNDYTGGIQANGALATRRNKVSACQ